ncbi:hypothetical protein ACO0LL_02350 [Undibacterium sp. TC4M20W]|uniref:hypothetical protein n=1 Tax=Undibacterium sp. TC4M20W TaxID=3413052 RepID=UPI003BEF837A
MSTIPLTTSLHVSRNKKFQFHSLGIAIKRSGREIYDFDLRKLAFFGGAELPPKSNDYTKIIKLLGKPISERIPLVMEIYQVFMLSIADGILPGTIGTRLMLLRKYFSYCESNSLPLEKSVEATKKALAAWIQFQWKRCRNGEITETSAHGNIWGVLSVFKEVLNCSSDELIGRITLPRADKESRTHEKMDINAVERFLFDLEDIINSLDLQTVRGKWPMRITFRSGTSILYNGKGHCATESTNTGYLSPYHVNLRRKRNSNTSFAARRHAINLRTSAETLAFIGATGTNIQVAIDLQLVAIKYESFGDQYKIVGFKNRRQESVEIRIPKTYRAKLEDWLAFRNEVFKDVPVERFFPILNASHQEITTTGERGFRELANVLSRAGRPRVPAVLLRFARAQKLIRSAAIGGDLVKVASELQHGLPTLLKSYLKGSQQMASVELGRYFSSIQPEEAKNKVRAGGSCNNPDAPNSFSNEADVHPTPDCMNPVGCFFCVQYRAIENFDYIHSILSYKEFLKMRLKIQGTIQSIDPMISASLERIDDHVQAAIQSSKKISSEAVAAIEEIKAENYHPKWRGWIELMMMQEG